MFTLAINTASSTTSIALFDGSEIRAHSSWQAANNEAEKLMPAIQKLLTSQKKDFDDLKRVFVISGPGSFTGLRVGVTVANTIAYLTKADLVAADIFTLYWQTERDSSNSALLIFAGKGGVYLSLQEDAPDFVNNARQLNLAELSTFIKKNKIQNVFGDISEEQKEVAVSAGAKFFTSENFPILTAKLLQNNLPKHKMVKPQYIKLPSITISKKKLF